MGKALSVLAMIATLLAPSAQERTATLLHIKAAFLYKFAIYIEWPEKAFSNPEAPLVIGVLGSEPFARSVEEGVVGKSVRGRSFKVRRYSWPQDISADTHILYIDRDALTTDAAATLTAVHKRAPYAFVVSDGADAAEAGATLAFVIKQDKLGFHINLDQAKEAGVKISSKLLRLATIVESGETAP
jgi:hypothetical protein